MHLLRFLFFTGHLLYLEHESRPPKKVIPEMKIDTQFVGMVGVDPEFQINHHAH
jgi:hypothetical protein